MKMKMKMKMKKRKDRSVFKGIKAGLLEAVAIAKGEAEPARVVYVPGRVDVKAIRKKLHMTQSEFAARFSFNVARVRDWEQGRSQPDSALRAYLLVIERQPKAVQKALKAA
jgi:putative transcriptional regulator